MGEAPSAVFPSLEELLAAMDGRWEREHPAADLLHGAQLQARVHLLYRVLELTVLQVAADGTVARGGPGETAAAAHGLLAGDLDIDAVVAAAVGTDLAEAAGGRRDPRAQGLTWVIDEIAARRADLCLAYLSGSSAGDADAPFATVCRYYTRFATTPAAADDHGAGDPVAVASAGASPAQ